MNNNKQKLPAAKYLKWKILFRERIITKTQIFLAIKIYLDHPIVLDIIRIKFTSLKSSQLFSISKTCLVVNFVIPKM